MMCYHLHSLPDTPAAKYEQSQCLFQSWEQEKFIESTTLPKGANGLVSYSTEEGCDIYVVGVQEYFQ